ncbi:MAG: prepilin-type N-terminal cleavage/methylation domain-containing protein [Candidatus Omnitrophica bacterium]|nr:prepilin-type N-terminal cleavage/methylation domain-containing protein [Candidatus Omnitrophota bacterium]
MNIKGLTLLEILVSMFIFSIIMLGLINVFVASKRLILSSRAQIAAAELARFALGNLSLQVNQGEWGNNCLSNSSRCVSYNKTLDNINYVITYNTSQMFTIGSGNITADNLYKAKGRIAWDEIQP